MILYTFDGIGKLPSIDIKSLQMMAYAKFMKMDTIQFEARSFKPYIADELPRLICEKGTITEFEEFIEYLKFEAGSNQDLRDNSFNKLDPRFKPYDILLKETLKPALINVMWSDEQNYHENTRRCYSKITSFPLNFVVPSYLRGKALTYMENVYPIKNRKDYFALELVEKSKNVIKMLSDELSESLYFNSSTPNEIDALIFGYLALILETELPRFNNLQTHIKEHTNLMNYVNRILNQYFPSYIIRGVKTDQVDAKKSKQDLENVSWKSVLFVGFAAITVNFVYLLYMISEFEARDEDEDDDSDEED